MSLAISAIYTAHTCGPTPTNRGTASGSALLRDSLSSRSVVLGLSGRYSYERIEESWLRIQSVSTCIAIDLRDIRVVADIDVDLQLKMS